MLDQNRSRIVSLIRVLLAALLFSFFASAQLVSAPAQPGTLSYKLRYAGAGDSHMSLQITPETPLPSPIVLVVPRSYPGGYSFVRYDDFVEDIHAFSPDGKLLDCTKDPDGPRWSIGQKGQSVGRIEYRVNLVKMEDQIPARANVDLVGKYNPPPIGVNKHRKGLTPEQMVNGDMP